MKYPLLMRKINRMVARVSGAIIFLIAVFAVYEAITRYFFARPTSWTLNISSYIFIWAIFLGSAYAFQEHGHVAVDLLRDFVDKRTSPSHTARRVMSIGGYSISFIVVSVFLYGGWRLCIQGIALNELAPAVFYFPLIWVYPSIVIGSALMILTLVFIILDLFAGNEEYL